MPKIRPISDLRTHFTEIAEDVEATQQPVFLTRNGVGAMVVMSMEAYEQGLYESDVYDKLREAELQAKASMKRRTHTEVMDAARARLNDIVGGQKERA